VRDGLITDFRRDTTGGYVIRSVSTDICVRAGDLCRTYPLHAYDAVQLAALLSLRDEALAASAPAPIFVSSDSELLRYAAAEGLAVEDPNRYP
jgi:hypothetical protein